jgi:hypothetical protein
MKIADAKVPGLGNVNILSPAAWLQMILGVIMILVTVAVGQNIKNKVGAKLPFDTEIDPFVKMPTPANLSPAKRVY